MLQMYIFSFFCGGGKFLVKAHRIIAMVFTVWGSFVSLHRLLYRVWSEQKPNIFCYFGPNKKLTKDMCVCRDSNSRRAPGKNPKRQVLNGSMTSPPPPAAWSLWEDSARELTTGAINPSSLRCAICTCPACLSVIRTLAYQAQTVTRIYTTEPPSTRRCCASQNQEWMFGREVIASHWQGLGGVLLPVYF